ncbi:hypothetical protein DFQ28_004940 [Apophysomyces sp. BC1034]|nr:hypothetical protein DFQ30_000988 [Apophysomyces sp. BC1015]KAG0180614.1 hypothetical protein DFQ29_000324 [Apophysomyces sp. BC1021]KAG0188364.1 hypothetical protein DFQ28_004940 [Apophysomyces sp. BC1034]
MPCFGSRKASNKTRVASIKDHNGSRSSLPQSASLTAVAQMKQEYADLKIKNNEQLGLITRQSAELEHLRQQLDKNQKDEPASVSLNELEMRNKEALAALEQKESTLKQREKEIADLLHKIEQEKELGEKACADQLAERDEQLKSKEKELEELQLKWKAEQAALVKPALDEVTKQMEQLKIANEEAVGRLAEKENELVELRSELTRRDRRPKNQTQDQERQKRMNRLTVDLEHDRLLIQKLDELNQQLEVQKQKHEAVLQTHAEAMAEKDRVLVEQEKSLGELKGTHDRAMKTLQREQAQTLEAFQERHERDMKQLRERLGHAEKRAKSDMNDEVERLLQEFEQSEHSHSVQVADLQKSHREQVSVMKRGQQAELKQWMGNSEAADDKPKVSLRKTGGPGSKMRWPITAMQDKSPEVVPRDPSVVQVYMSSVSTNSAIKRNQESMQTMLTSSQIQYQVVDVAQSEQALQYMRRQSTTDRGRAKSLPQIFVGGEYRGQLEDLTTAIDNGQLEHLLRPREKSSQLLSVPLKQKSTSSLSSSGPITPTSSTPVIQPKKVHDEDDELLKEMAMELSRSDFAKFNFDF